MSNTHPYPGVFIALEGIDGSGTTTQARLLYDRLSMDFDTVLVTAEPAETNPIGALIRQYLKGDHPLPAAPERVSSSIMALLFSADRLLHAAEELLPVLKAGGIVICDRYFLSTLAYHTRKLDRYHWIEYVNTHAILPDINILLDIDPAVGLARTKDRDKDHEFYETIEKQLAVAENYHLLVRDLPANELRVVDAYETIDEVADSIYAIVAAVLDRKLGEV